MIARVRSAQETRWLRRSRTHSSLRRADGRASSLPSGLLVGRLPVDVRTDPAPLRSSRRATRFADALREAPVAALASEEMEEPLALRQGGPLLVAVDPIDGSSNIDADVTIGTIFSILPAADADGRECGFLQPGNRQLAAGFLVYGPYTSLVLSLGRGVGDGVGVQVGVADRGGPKYGSNVSVAR